MNMPRLPLALCSAMVCTAIAAIVLNPEQLRPAGDEVILENLVPETFGNWSMDKKVEAYIAPNAADTAYRFYGQILNRTYVDEEGNRILLTVAYSANQSDSLSAHRPEVCYRAQGFSVSRPATQEIQVADGTIRARRLVAESGIRHEPITYWVVIGNRIVSNRRERTLQSLNFALQGMVPDRLLVRISSISRDSVAAYRDHDNFVQQLAAAIDPLGSRKLMGAGNETPEKFVRADYES